jgi:rhodanese-related sulfurtransferase
MPADRHPQWRQRRQTIASVSRTPCTRPINKTLAAQVLRDAGMEHLTLVQGGTEAWQKAGLPLNSCDSALSLDRQVQIAVGSLLILKVFFGFTVHELFFVAGAAIGAGLITAGITRSCGMARLIARMPWNRRPDCGHVVQT